MRSRLVSVLVVFVIMLSVGDVEVSGACPSMDVTGDCRVDLEDFAVFASQWLTSYDTDDLAIMASQWLMEGVPEDPCNLVWVSIDDPGIGSGLEGFDGQMSKYETTNAQYCRFLNAALASEDITVSYHYVYGANGSNSGADFVGELYFKTYAADSESQITYSGGIFSVRSRDGYSMNDHPVVEVSWYGATAFCNYYGFRLPTEWEWQAVADYDGSYTYGCGASIDQSKANYYLGDEHCNPLGLSSYPYTSPVNHYSSYGYGMNDMAGNVWEWTSTVSGGYRVFRGGSWDYSDYICTVSYRSYYYPTYTFYDIGFRVCR